MKKPHKLVMQILYSIGNFFTLRDTTISPPSPPRQDIEVIGVRTVRDAYEQLT